MLNILCFLCSSCEECRSRKRCPHVCVFRGIGEKHPRDWLLLFADPISYTFGGLKLRFRTDSKIPCSSNLWLLNKHIWAQIKALRVVGRRTIICYSRLVLIKLFVTRFHCICPDYHHIAPESTKLGRLRKTQKKLWSAGERRFENSHSNFSLKEKSEGAGEMADSIPRYFSQRLPQLSSAILKWNRGRKILQYLKEIRRWWAGKYCSI